MVRSSSPTQVFSAEAPGIDAPPEQSHLDRKINQHVAGVVVRDVGRYRWLAGHLRISIGRREENERVIEVYLGR